MEEYFDASRLKLLPIGILVKINKEGDDKCLTARFVGLDEERTIIITIPTERNFNEQGADATYFEQDGLYEIKCIFDGRIIAFETKPVRIYEGRLIMCEYPEMIETRKLRMDTRYPCTISCDIHINNRDTLGVVTDISNGGCQINVDNDEDLQDFEQVKAAGGYVNLGLYFPYYEEVIYVDAFVKSVQCMEAAKQPSIGVAFDQQYEEIRLYLESLQLDSVSAFFN